MGQAFPVKPFRFVMPFPAGSTTDQVARYLAKQITDATAQPVIVENKGGANGVIGVQHAMTLPADGYTVLIATQTTQAVNVHVLKKLPYDPQTDFIPLTTLLNGGQVLVVSPSSPYQNLQDVIAAARKQPGKLTFASGNSGSRMAGEMLKQSAKVDLLHVPYKGIPPAITDLMGGQFDLLFSDGVSVLPHVKAGKLRALWASVHATAFPVLKIFPPSRSRVFQASSLQVTSQPTSQKERHRTWRTSSMR
jgi:tripartite-type tricarboxylate transporter receptor subunit TctC